MANELYRALKVKKKATAEQIKNAYRTLSKKHHPDKGGNPVEFGKIAQAYAVLSNPESRGHYDRTGEIPAPGKIESSALNTVSAMFHSAVEQLLEKGFDDMQKNLVEAMTAHAQKQINDFKKQLANLETAEVLYGNLDRRLGAPKNGAPDLIRGVINQRREQDAETKAHVTEALAVWNRAVEIITSIDCDAPNIDAGAMYTVHWGQTMTSGSW